MMDTEIILSEIRNNNRMTMRMLKHMHDEMLAKLRKITSDVTQEEQEIETQSAQTEKWFRTLVYYSVKLYGDEHELVKHYREAYKYETGKEWDEANG